MVELNILESVRPEDRPLVVSSVISIMKHLWPENWGPRSEWILENSVYALLEQPAPVTLAALPKLLTDENYRKQILKNVSDPAIQNFFRFYENQNDRLREEWCSPLINKTSKFITNPLLRSVIGQTTSSFDFRWAIDTGRALACCHPSLHNTYTVTINCLPCILLLLARLSCPAHLNFLSAQAAIGTFKGIVMPFCGRSSCVRFPYITGGQR